MAKADLYVNPNTGLVALKFLGVKLDDDKREGHAGAGLRVGEVRGFDPETAQRFVDLGIAEPIDAKEVAAAAKADAKSASDSAAASADAKAKAAAFTAADK